jgi:MraZ protein
MEAKRSSTADMLFVGEFVHTIDPQKRIAIPKDWRVKDSENKFYMLPGRHNSLQLMTHASFKELAEKLRKVSIADSKASIALAKLGASARICICDKQGRIPINEKLLEYAQIKKNKKVDSDLVLVGAFNSIQIWSKENWNKQQMSDSEMLDVLQKIEELPDDLTNILKR